MTLVKNIGKIHWVTNKTMTHPTLGPLFGSFKLQHFIFTAGFRLYNSWLHNNRTGIGMKMSDIKFPLISNHFTGSNIKQQNNPSSLYSYIGWRGSRRKSIDTIAFKQAVPLLIYLDIFKNYHHKVQGYKRTLRAKSQEYLAKYHHLFFLFHTLQ